MEKFLTTFFFLVLFSLSASAQNVPPYVTGQTGPIYKIKNRQTGFILEIPANPNQDALEREGTKCIERSDMGSANQQWYIIGDISSRTNEVYIMNRNSSQFLTGYAYQAYAYQSKQRYNGGTPVKDPAQVWNFTKVVDASGNTSYVIRGLGSGLALTPTATTEYASVSQQNMSNTNPLAQWDLVDITSATAGGNGALFPGTYKLTNVNSGLTLQVVSQSAEPGARIEQGKYIGIASQQWQIIDKRDANGIIRFAIINRLSGLALQILSQSTADQAPIEQGRFIGLPSQLWDVNLESSGSQTVTFQNVNSRYVMQVIGESFSDGAQMQQGGRVPIGSQLWKFEYIVPNRLAAPPTAGSPVVSESESLKVYPNPSSGELYIAPIAGETLSEVTILNMQGKVIAKLPVKASDKIDVSSLAAGLYVASVKGAQSSYHAKFIKN
jgi:hypothetical protein